MSGLDNHAFTVRSVTADTTLNQTDYVLLVSPTANTTVTLPAVSTVATGRIYYVKRDGTAVTTVTLDGSGAETINGAATRAVGAAATHGGVLVVSNGTGWDVLASY